jgi:polyisoprenoid-binding protein YceI
MSSYSNNNELYFCKKKKQIMTTKWNIDNMHSEIGFKVRHMMISNVRGSFANFSATVETEDEEFTSPSFSFSAKVDSIQTGVSDRDGHLISADFFDAANYPTLDFTSNSVEKIAEDKFAIHGNMTIKGKTLPVVLNAEYAGIVQDPYGQTKAGLTVEGKIKRSEFGLTWSAVTEAGKVVVGDDIHVTADLQFIKS